jgi:hypothetical protein
MLVVDDIPERFQPGQQNRHDEQNADPFQHERQQADHVVLTFFLKKLVTPYTRPLYSSL